MCIVSRDSQMKGDVCGAVGCQRAAESKGWCRMHAERVRRHGSPERAPLGPAPKPMAERLALMVDSSAGPDECWPFLGCLSREGYGQIRTGGAGTATIGAHRAAFLVANAESDAPEAVDHICHDPAECRGGPTCPHRQCCNPSHLVAATLVENSSRERQWTRAQLTHCKHGHEFTPENTYNEPGAGDGRSRRACRKCNAARKREPWTCPECGKSMPGGSRGFHKKRWHSVEVAEDEQ